MPYEGILRQRVAPQPASCQLSLRCRKMPALRAGLDEAQAHRTLEILDASAVLRLLPKSWFTAPNAALRRRSPSECLYGSWVPEKTVTVRVLLAARVAPEASARTI